MGGYLGCFSHTQRDGLRFAALELKQIACTQTWNPLMIPVRCFP